MGHWDDRALLQMFLHVNVSVNAPVFRCVHSDIVLYVSHLVTDEQSQQ